MKRNTARRLSALTILGIVGVIALDQLTKWLAVTHLTPGQPEYLVGTWLKLLLVRNPGAAFSVGESYTWIFALFQAGALLLCIALALRNKKLWIAVPLAFIGGGAGGNLMDRLFREPGFFRGHVVDFISVGTFPVFNLADSAINVGVAILFVYFIFVEPRQRAKTSGVSTEAGGQK